MKSQPAQSNGFVTSQHEVPSHVSSAVKTQQNGMPEGQE